MQQKCKYPPEKGKEGALRRIAYLITLLLFMSFSMESFAQEKKISIEFNNEKASTALRKVESLSGQRIQFNYNDVNFNVTLSVKDKTAFEMVQAIIQGHGLKVEKGKNNYLVIMRAPAKQPGAALVVNEGTVMHGKVLDENGEPLAGATVMIKDTNEGTTTDLNGKYTLVTKRRKGTVVYSFVGYKAVELPLKSTYGLKDIRLQSDTQMDDVVVTGFFDKEKNTFTGSFTKVTHDQITEFGTANIFNILQVLDPSFKIKENNEAGSNPNALPDFVVRGESSFQGSSLPTIIVDGYEVSVQYLYDMDVERIESISILKDASATVYYGSRAANGVLIIETRRPVAGKFRVSYSNRTGVTWADLSSYDLMNAAEKLEFERLSGVYSSTDPNPTSTHHNC